MIRPTVYCDECGRIKGDANHWFRALSGPDHIFMVIPWGNGENAFFGEEDEQQLHLCSESCAVKAMLKAIGAGE